MKHPRLIVLLIVILLAGCIKVPGDKIVVTHTPAPEQASGAPTEATATPELPTLTPEPPAATTSATATATPELPTLTPEPPAATAAASPAGTYGPVIGPSYTPPPTETPVPPTPAPTDTPPGPTPTPMPRIHSNIFGIQIHPLIHEDAMIDWLNRVKFEVGARWIKFQVEWELLEPNPGERGQEWWVINNHINHAHERGFQVMISVVSAPNWARTAVDDPAYPSEPYPEEGPPDDYQLYANFINDIAQGFAGRVDAIEIWNEPNLQREWFGKPLSGAEYMRLFDTVYRTVRAGSSPGMILVTAAPAPTGINDGTAVSDRQYLRQMYDAGLANYDSNVKLGVHPYGWGNAPSATCATDCNAADRGWNTDPSFFFLDTINDYRAIMEQYGDGGRMMWVTEFGWPTFDGFGVEPDPAIGYFNYVSAWNQGHYIVEALAYGYNQPFIERMFLWNLDWAVVLGGDGIQSLEQEAGYSIVLPDGSPRPSYELITQIPKDGHPALVGPDE